ncbi:hypothetical protein [Aquitalea pelogenes]|uniref:hypothetical protein n=1 Tax=Aquitalea pelogenes TaxID=1293573 RepID=UPI0035B06160
MKVVKVEDEFFMDAKLAGKTFNQHHADLKRNNKNGELKIAERELEKIKELQVLVQAMTEQRKQDRLLVDSLFKTVKLQEQKINAQTDAIEKLTDVLTKAITRR